MEKILFLDIDGVLNSTRYMASKANVMWNNSDLDFEAVQRLAKIVEDTKCSIVVSSTWRLWGIGPDSRIQKAILARDGKIICEAIIDKTIHRNDKNYPYGKKLYRGDEIQIWLEDNKFTGKFVILDDDSDMGRLKDFLVKTNIQKGLTDYEMGQVIERLK
jgi:hypothetical protein